MVTDSDLSISVFISYSHKDERYRQELGTALASLRHEELISEWHDRQIQGGEQWDEKIKTQLEKSDIILLLLSADFIASDYVRKNEIPAAIARHERGEAVVIPVFIRQFDYSQNAPYAKLQGYPDKLLPVDKWPNRDEAYFTVAQGIRGVVERILKDRKQKRANLERARLTYRTKAKELLADGKINAIERDTLDELKEKENLSDADAEQIEREEMAPYRKKDDDKDKYRKTLLKVVELEFPISAESRASLNERMRDLGLNADDVRSIESDIFEETKARITERLERAKEQASDALARAEAALAQKQFAAALEHFSAARAAHPSHPAIAVLDTKINDAAEQARREADDALAKAKDALAQRQFAAARERVAAARWPTRRSRKLLSGTRRSMPRLSKPGAKQMPRSPRPRTPLRRSDSRQRRSALKRLSWPTQHTPKWLPGTRRSMTRLNKPGTKRMPRSPWPRMPLRKSSSRQPESTLQQPVWPTRIIRTWLPAMS